MFYHGYENYMKYAFPEDELRPISCQPLTRDRANPAHIELNDALGNYSLTLIDSLSTLAILASSPTYVGSSNKALQYFQSGVAALVEQYGDGTDGPAGQGVRAEGFDVDSKVQVFETVIRGVGGLVSAHLFAMGDLPISGYPPPVIQVEGVHDQKIRIPWKDGFMYDGQLLRLAINLASRLLPAFQTATGIPYPRVNLRYGIPFYANAPSNNDAEHGQCIAGEQATAERTETCAAGAGSLVLEMTTLSRLTGIPIFEQVAKRAFWAVWDRRSAIGLVGSGIDAESGLWTTSYTGVGAGIDSFYEYAAKSYFLLSGSPSSMTEYDNPKSVAALSLEGGLSEKHERAESYLEVWRASHAAIHRHLHRGQNFVHPHYIQADLFTGSPRAFWFDSLSAFYPGLLAITGDIEEAVQAQLLFTALWTRYSAIPERWSTSSGGIEAGLSWWGGRPEFIESNYHLYRATEDPWYLHVGEMVLRDIKRRSWTKCGWAGIQDVRRGEKSDRMESFFLSETSKYLFLLFDPDHPLNGLDAPFVFSTEGHPLIIPKRRRRIPKVRQDGGKQANETETLSDINNDTCPVRPRSSQLGVSWTASRSDVFHAANLARLHLMPTPRTIESPLVEYSTDHPSISISDVTSPSNYTFFPWTLPLDLVPPKGTCAVIKTSPTFEISFPQDVGTLLGFAGLQRITNGILINSIKGLRLALIQDVSMSSEDQGDLYRVQAINNILLGKDESVFLPKTVINDAVSPQDPNFTRVRDLTMLDLVIDVATPDTEIPHQQFPPTVSSAPTYSNRKNFTSPSSSHVNKAPGSFSAASGLPLAAAEKCDSPASPIKVAFDSLIKQVSSLLHDAKTPASQNLPFTRHYIPAITPSGSGAAPPPDAEEALGPDLQGNPQGDLIWNTIYATDENCDSPLPNWIVRNHQILIIKRGTCLFSQKIHNIPAFAPAPTSLQLVVIVSSDEQNEAEGLPPDYLIRPVMDEPQMTPKGLPRYRPIPMVLVNGGEEMYRMFERAKGLGIKRRWRVEARGVRISNVIIT